MEKRKESLNSIKICRFCLSDNSLQSIYDRSKVSKKAVSLPLKILSSIGVEVFPSDKMPIYICNRCVFFMDLCHEYKQICRQADETILQFIQSGSSMDTIAWPTSLTKMFLCGTNLPSEPNVMKTVVEGGATVEVTSHDLSDSEGGDENVYNVKIEEGADEGSARIKIITQTENVNATKNTPKEPEFSSVTKLARHVRSHAGERPYPCKYCDKTFIKSHHYTRHLHMKHYLETSGAGAVDAEQYRCEQCDDTFSTQDDLIYHSAIHATQNLTCPLCQERFENVDAVTTHIKSHVNGIEFMCDFCELVFTTKEKLHNHLQMAHEDEIQMTPEQTQNESSMEIGDGEEEDDDNTINLKDEGDHMVVEIKKPDGFLISNSKTETAEKADNTNSEDSEAEASYMELATVDTLAMITKEPNKQIAEKATIKPALVATRPIENKSEVSNDAASILRKVEDMKRKVTQQHVSDTAAVEVKKEKSAKPENSSSGASDKSLRLLEKELQELKRTTTRIENPKTPAKIIETVRSNRRPQLHTSTPKLSRTIEDKKAKVVTIEKKLPERRAVKENKEPKDVKETKTANICVKEKKEVKISSPVVKEDKEREAKENDTPKSIVIKNGTAEKSTEDGIRRSTRPSKVKDYAKMIRDRAPAVSDDDDSDDDDDEYTDNEKVSEPKPKTRRSVGRPSLPKTTKATPVPTGKKRGRPRKDQSAHIPAKLKKDDKDDEEMEKGEKESEDVNCKEEILSDDKELDDSKNSEENESTEASTSNTEKKAIDVLKSPTGQTLKKVPIKALPPGVRPLPLPVNARPLGAGELCEMQIGKKMVKVQKIVMTKAEVEAMAKKGLLEMKDGTMVLKQGIKIPSDPVALKSTLVGQEIAKESPTKKDKATPTRCDIGE